MSAVWLPPWSRSATWPATSSGRRSSWPSGWGSRSCSRASRAWARPRRPRPWPRRSIPRWSGCSATRASRPPRPCTSGTTRVSCWPSGSPRRPGEHISDKDLFTEEYLLPRPLLTALLHPGPRPAVLLIDEVDRADDEFEAFLFELLAEAAVTIPELGTQQANLPPVTVLTSNRTRDLHDALKRRCLYHWIAYPDSARVAEIVRRRVPAVGGAAGRADRDRRQPAAQPGPHQAARHLRGDQLGLRAERLRCRRVGRSRWPTRP